MSQNTVNQVDALQNQVNALAQEVVDLMNRLKMLNAHFEASADVDYKESMTRYMITERNFLVVLRALCKAQHESEGSE